MHNCIHVAILIPQLFGNCFLLECLRVQCQRARKWSPPIINHKQTLPHEGQKVIVRRRPALVRSIDKHEKDGQGVLHQVQVDYIDNWAYPESDEVIWELERETQIFDRAMLPRVEQGRPDDPQLLRAFLYANRWSAVNHLMPQTKDKTNTLRLISPWQSAIQVEDYQLYPVLKALMMPRISLLLADDVGLGKTIETGLILSELFTRRRIRRVLVICPASLQLQWRDEMKEKFHLDFTIVDREETFKLQRELGVDSNPWASYPRIITSMDYLRQQDVLGSFIAATNHMMGDTGVLPWQMLVVDEAHNLTPARYGDESDRCSMLRRIAPHFEHRLFLSATPHNGYTLAFTGLLELLDPVRFQQKSYLDEQDREQIAFAMVRRLKKDFTQEGTLKRFAERKIEALTVDLTPDERELFAALRAYRQALSRVLGTRSPRERHLGEFLSKLLTKRLLSSSYAFARTWWRHVEGLELASEAEGEEVAAHTVERAEATTNDDQERDQREEDAVKQAGSWLQRYASALQEERQEVSTCLERLGWNAVVIEEVSQRSGEHPLDNVELPPDARWEELNAWIEKYLKADGKLRDDERLIIFTEYKHTLDYLLERLRRVSLDAPEVACLFGGATSALREHVKDAFNSPRSPLRILVGTDTVSEGISLQMTCRYVIHQEIPWNPMRLEQRNGRVDRHGQEREVKIFHFASNNEEDLNFMQFVVKKVDTARGDLGSVGQVIDETVEEYFTQGISNAQALLDQRVQAVRSEARDLEDMRTRDEVGQADYERAMEQLHLTESQLELSPGHLAHLLRMALSYDEVDPAKKGLLEEQEERNTTTGQKWKVYKLKKIPPAWKKLVRSSLERQQGRTSALPKLVFDPAYFEERHEGRRIFKPRQDAELIRLGHPLMQRALGVLRRRLWDSSDEQGLQRWTIEGCELPYNMEKLLVVSLLLEVTNAFREVVHQEVLELPFIIQGGSLNRFREEQLWEEIRRKRREPLSSARLKREAENVRVHWPEQQEFIRELVSELNEQYRVEFTRELSERQSREAEEEQKCFEARLAEIHKLKNHSELQKMLREHEKQMLLRAQLERQPSLLPEVESERLSALGAVQRNIYMHASKISQAEAESSLKRLEMQVQSEEERIIKQVLPRRYTLATVDVQPLALEYLVRVTGEEAM